MLRNKAGVFFVKLVIVTERQSGFQMDQISSLLEMEIYDDYNVTTTKKNCYTRYVLLQKSKNQVFF